LGHHHHHHHAEPSADGSGARGLFIALGLTASYMLAEVIGGLWSGSLALLADAGHMLSDSAALALSLFAMWLARRPAEANRTYGFHRTEVLAALINSATLLIIAVLIVVEAYGRLHEPPDVQGLGMLLIASGGLAMNILALFALRKGKDASINLRGAWLHVASDALGSVGAMASGVAVWQFGWRWADPVASIIIAVLVAHSAWALLREALGVLMEHAPESVDVDDLQRLMVADVNVDDVHDLHVWTITSGLVCLSAHVVTETVGEDREDTLTRLTELAKREFGIDHITIQLERPAFESCAKCR
jgi:cobalt-zinc-cadmium efflux system protein